METLETRPLPQLSPLIHTSKSGSKEGGGGVEGGSDASPTHQLGKQAYGPADSRERDSGSLAGTKSEATSWTVPEVKVTSELGPGRCVWLSETAHSHTPLGNNCEAFVH
ncbi:hypothetical protein O3P69_001404 [Scylla paramamosain]|uniref:Uncharacterized protein n=1 Tax=Scylla paramamosain TaxID=85552 RepID=A0AAW0UYI1_SCYPA